MKTGKRRFTQNRLVFALVLLALSSAGGAKTQGVSETRLESGLTVLIKEVCAAPVFTAQLWFKVGSRNERTGITGISHFLEHMLFNSSKNYKKGEISKLVSEHGGIENAATWTDFTYYWQLMAPEHLEFSIKCLAERAGNALLLEREVAKERTVILSEMEGRENDPGWLLFRDLCATAFLAHPYQWPVIGWRSDVEQLSRADLWDYYQQYYHPDNATLVLVGDFDPARALKLARKYFGGSARKASKLPKDAVSIEPKQAGTRRVTVRKEGNAERVILAYHIPDINHPDTYPLMLLDQILSGGRSSRLYQALVEKQLATSAWSSVGSRRDPSLFLLGATAQSGVNSAELEKSLLAQVESAQSLPPTSAEMAAAINQLEAHLIFQNDSVSDQGEQLGYYNTIASWKFLDTLIPRIKAVTGEQVQSVARKYLVPDNLTVGEFVPLGDLPRGGGGGGIPDTPTHLFRWIDTSEHRAGAALPSGSAGRPGGVSSPNRVQMRNGIVLIVQENHSNPTVAVSARLRAGSCFDPNNKRGVASLAAEMITRGTSSRTALQLAEQIESVGASLVTSAEVEFVDISGRVLARDLPMLLEVMADEVRNPTFPEEQLDRVRGQMLSRLQQQEESTDAQAYRAFHSSVFPEGHPYHQPTFKQAATELRSVIREDLAGFHKAFYRPDTMTIVIVGDVTPKEALQLVTRRFGDWSVEGPKPVVDIPTVPPQNEPKSITVPMPGKSEATAILGYALGVKRSDPDFYAVRLMNQALGGSGALTSLLGEELREKQGLVYDVYSVFDAGLGAGPWYATLGTNPSNLDKALEAVRKVIERYRSRGPSAAEFERARDFTIGILSVALESNAGVARVLLNSEFYGLGMNYLRDYPAIHRAVTLDQARAAAKKYLHPEAATLVIAGTIDKAP